VAGDTPPDAAGPPATPEEPTAVTPQTPEAVLALDADTDSDEDANADTTVAPAIRPETRPLTIRRGVPFGYVVYLALALGTFPLPGEVRFALLLTLLAALGGLFLFFDEDRPPGAIDPLNFTWGAGVGFVLGLPVMLLASRALGRTAEALVPVQSLPALFQLLLLTWPLGETLFYRGAIQREYGLIPAALTAALGNALLYWPETGGVFAVLFVAVIFATALAFIYSYVRRQYGLAAAFACQVMANTLLIFIPRLLTTPPACHTLPQSTLSRSAIRRNQPRRRLTFPL
jgi:hypothetical protein